MRIILANCHKRLLELDEEIETYAKKIENFCKQTPICQRLIKLAGVGHMIASIVYATVGDVNHFKNSRHFAAFLGLVPRANKGIWLNAYFTMQNIKSSIRELGKGLLMAIK